MIPASKLQSRCSVLRQKMILMSENLSFSAGSWELRLSLIGMLIGLHTSQETNCHFRSSVPRKRGDSNAWRIAAPLWNKQTYREIPVALHHKLSDTFKCNICHQSLPPIIFACCCKNLVGCSSCVDAWYGGEDGMSKSCMPPLLYTACPVWNDQASWLGWIIICPPSVW